MAASSRFLTALLLIYFLASTADLLHVEIGFFKVKLGLLAPLLLLPLVKTWQIPRPLFHAFLLILISQALSALFGAAPLRSFGYISIYCLNFIFYFLLPYTLVQTLPLYLFFRAYWGAFFLIGFYATLQVLLSLFGIYDPFALQRAAHIARGQAWFYEPSYYALYITSYTMFHNTLALLRKASSFKLFWQNLFLVLSTSTGLLVIYPLFFGLSFLIPAARKKLKLGLLAFGLVLLTISLCFHNLALATLYKFFAAGFGHGSFSERWGQGFNSLTVFIKHPFLGVGLGGVGPYLFTTTAAHDTSIATLAELDTFDPNLCFAEILGSLGLFGLFVLLNLFLLFYRTFRALINTPSISPETKQIGTALFLSLLISICALQMNQNIFRPYIWIHAAIVYGYCSRMLNEEACDDTNSTKYA